MFRDFVARRFQELKRHSRSMDKTKAEKDGEVDTTSGAFSKVMREVLSYKDVYYNPLSWRFLLMVCIEPCWTHVLGTPVCR